MDSFGPDVEAEQMRAAVQARLAAIVESSDDAIVSKNLNGIVVSWNKGAERIFGWTGDEMVGRPITTIIPADRQGEEVDILSRLRRGERVDHFETVRVTKDGRLLNISVTISPIRDDTGKIIGASKIARDITLQKRIQQELELAREAAEQAKLIAEQAREAADRAREEAERANRAKDHFLSVLSHELRTPLTPVLGALSLMQDDPSVPVQLHEQVSMIRRNLETEARLVDDLLDLTRIARGTVQLHHEVVDAHAILRNVVTMFQQQTEEKGLTVAVALRAKRFHVWADPGRFQQILLNLFSNAVKFTPEEGTITIRTSNENGTVKIEIADTGIGIESDVLPRLFQPFEQGEVGMSRSFGGLGLGLSIVKSLVEMHHGSISATSKGKGSGAVFTLRIDTLHDVQRPQVSAPVFPTVQHNWRVLLVEDHVDTRMVMTQLLRNMGCQVTAVGSVKEAIATVASQQFDLLLSDIGLPDGTGLDVMRHVTREYAGLKGIAISGFGQDDDLLRSKEAGFDVHLTKPVNLQALQEAIKRVVE